MRTVSGVFSIVLLVPATLPAQSIDLSLLTNWPAPLYWQPSPAEAESATFRDGRAAPRAQAPVNSLVFVAMTPCRVADTRTGQGFTGAFGPPSLLGGASRTFPMQLSTTCTIPAIAQGYSLNVAVVPQGTFHFLTMYPTGQPQPLASTLNDPLGVVMANAAIVPAGSPNGGVDVFVTNNSDIVLDINGYYAPQTGITLAQGSAGAPSLSFVGDAGTGMFSSGAQTLNLTTGGTSRLTVRSDGDLDIPGSVRKNGFLFLHNLGTQNLGIGVNALAVNTGTGNTGIGLGALAHNTTGSSNTASGDSALFNNTTGLNNTACGINALLANITGSNNTAVGNNALLANTTGNGNTALGLNSGINPTGNNNIMIGNQGVAGDDHTIRMGDVQTKAFIAGIRGITTGNNDAMTVMVDSSGQLGTTSSSRRFKEDIHDMDDASSNLLRLRPVTYRYKQSYADGSKPLDYGLIAEEVAEVYPDLVVKGKDGRVETVQYHKLTPMLLNEVQKQTHHAQQQDETIRQQHLEIEALKAKLAALEALLSGKITSVATAGQ